jgi:hypothetical protein
MGRGHDRRQPDQSSLLLGQALLQCAESCERVLQEYVLRLGLSTRHDLFRDLLPAIATVRTAIDLLGHQSPRRELALQLVHEACRRAATRCRRYGFDESLLLCAAACDRVVVEVELVLTVLGHEETR